MPGELVVDASVAAKLYFDEEQSDLAKTALSSADRLIAPELLFVEMASLAAKYSRRGIAPHERAATAVESISALLDEAIPLANLAEPAFALAAAHGFSAYDACYLVLAEVRGTTMLTADVKLVRRSRSLGLPFRLTLLGEH